MRISYSLVALVGAVAVLGVVGCGGSGSNSASSGAPAASSGTPDGRRGFASDPKVAACLEKQGVTVPDRRPDGDDGRTRTTPEGGFRGRRGGDPAQFQKLREALQECGVTLPQRPQGAPPAGGRS